MKPIAIKIARFVSPQDGPGLNAASSVSSVPHGGRPSRYSLHYDVRSQLLRVAYQAQDADPIVSLIPSTRIMDMTPSDDFLLGDTEPAKAPPQQGATAKR